MWATMSAFLSIRRSKRLAPKVKSLLEEFKTATNGGCMNGNCQRIVSEEELPALLAEGWRVVTALPSGKIVVSDTS